MKTKVNEKLATREIKRTNDHDKFKTLKGNRTINQAHVNQLVKLLVANGNLTDQFPIVVDKKGYVIDGQHRLEALRILDWEVGYIVEHNATIDTVRHINQGNRNWNWRDIAESYANLGNKEYEWFIDFVDSYEGLSYTLATRFVSLGNGRNNDTARAIFKSGDMVIEDKMQAKLFAEQWDEIKEIVDIGIHDFGKALNRIFRSPYYDHERMVAKVQSLGHTLPAKANESDYLRLLEEMYNHAVHEENRVRLF